MLRRHAATYEGIFGELPKSDRDGRLYDALAVQRIGAALAAYHAGSVVSVEDGLRRIAEGEETPEAMFTATQQPDTMELLLGELRGLRVAVERQNELLQTQGDRIAELEAQGEKQLHALGDGEQVKATRPWWRLWRRS